MIALYHLCSGTPLATMPQEVQAAFALVAGADRTSTNPGGGPCLVIIDEWVAEARELFRDDALPGDIPHSLHVRPDAHPRRRHL